MKSSLRKILVDNSSYQPLTFSELLCPVCETKKIKKPDNSWVGKCPACATYFNFWKPYPSQTVVLELLRKKRTVPQWIYAIGAMNTGKTDCDMAAAVEFAMQRPGSTQGFLALNMDMLKRVAKESLDPFIHPDWIARKDGKLQQSIANGYRFSNGSTMYFLPSDDENKVKSMNTSKWTLIEAEKLPLGLVHALSGRLREDSGVVYEQVWNEKEQRFEDALETVSIAGVMRTRKKMKQSFYAITVEANPDADSHVYDEGLLESAQVFHTQSVRGFATYEAQKTKNNDYKATVISATPDSPYIKNGYIEEKLQTWSEDEQRRNLYGEFVAGDNLIYPEFFSRVIEPQSWDRSWPHWIGIDPGYGKDPTAMLLMAYSPNQERFLVIDEYYEYQPNLPQIAAAIKKWQGNHNVIDIIIDPSSKKRLQVGELGTSMRIELEALLETTLIDGINAIDEGIQLIKDRMAQDKLVFSNKCVNLYMEMQNYKWLPKERRINGKLKPIDKFNHLMDVLRYLTQATQEGVIRDIIEGWESLADEYNALRGAYVNRAPKLPWVTSQTVTSMNEDEESWGNEEVLDFGSIE